MPDRFRPACRAEPYRLTDGTTLRVPHWTWLASLQARECPPLPPRPEVELPAAIREARETIRSRCSRYLASLPTSEAREAYVATHTRHAIAGRWAMLETD